MRPNKYIRNREYLKRLEKKNNSLKGSKYLITYITKEPDPRYIRESAYFRLPRVYIDTPARFEEYMIPMLMPFDDDNYYYFSRPEVEYGIKKHYNSSGYSISKKRISRATTKQLRQEKHFEELPLNNSLYKKLHISYRYY